MSASFFQPVRNLRVMRSRRDSEQPTTGHPAKANCCMVLSLVNWHSEKAALISSLVDMQAKKSPPERANRQQGLFLHLTRTVIFSPVLVMMRIASDNRLHESAIGCYSSTGTLRHPFMNTINPFFLRACRRRSKTRVSERGRFRPVLSGL